MVMAIMARSTGGADVLALVFSDRYVDAVREIVPRGAAAVFDANGGSETLLGVDVLRPRGALVLYGAAGGPPPEFDLGRLGAGSFFVTRASGRDYARTPEQWRVRAADVLARERGPTACYRRRSVAPQHCRRCPPALREPRKRGQDPARSKQMTDRCGIGASPWTR